MLQFPDCLFLIGLELGDSTGFFENSSAVLRPGTENPIYASLLHQRIGRGSNAGVHEQALNVFETARCLIDEILAFSRPENTAGNGNLIVFGIENALALGECDAYFRHPQWFPGIGAVENAILHRGTAQGLGALFAYNPTYGVGNVAFSAPVGTHDTGHSRLEFELCFARKALEANHFQRSEIHSRTPQYLVVLLLPDVYIMYIPPVQP